MDLRTMTIETTTRTEARSYHDVIFQATAVDYDDPEEVARAEEEGPEISDELHADHDHIQLRSDDDGQTFCLHLFSDGSCYDCAGSESEIFWFEVLATIGGEEKLPAAAQGWIEKAKAMFDARAARFERWRTRVA